MARAHLSVSNEVSQAFKDAQENKTVRALDVCVIEESMCLRKQINCLGNASDDFEGPALETLQDTEASLLLFCIDDDRNTTLFSKWILVAWVPDGCKVRDKMLYSSSREDLRKTLGLGFFVSEYYANSKEDLTWSQVVDYMNTDKVKEDTPFSAAEIEVQQERALTHAESNATKSVAMGSLAFGMTEEVRAAMSRFKDPEANINWLDMRVVNEEIHLVDAKTVNAQASLKEYVSDEEARFIALRAKNANGTKTMSFFIFSCPENTPVRMKMTMSSCKASVLSSATEQGLAFDKNLEIRSPEDIDDSISGEMQDEDSGPSSAAASVVHAKPSRPGRGKPKTKKFTADDA